MTNGGEAADQIVRMSLEAGEVALKISGAGAKQLAVMLYTILKDQKKTKGRVRMETLIRSGKPLTVYSIKERDLGKFVKEAKEYGVLYCAVRNPRGLSDGMVDLMVKEEDAVRINRIVERFKFAAVKDVAKVKTEIEKTKEGKKAKEPEVPEQDKQAKDKEDQLVDELFEQPIQKEGRELKNPSAAKTVNPHPSEPTSKKLNSFEGGTSKLTEQKPSVREEIKKITAERKNEQEKEKQKERSGPGRKETTKQTTHQQPKKNGKAKKIKER